MGKDNSFYEQMLDAALKWRDASPRRREVKITMSITKNDYPAYDGTPKVNVTLEEYGLKDITVLGVFDKQRGYICTGYSMIEYEMPGHLYQGGDILEHFAKEIERLQEVEKIFHFLSKKVVS